MKIWLYRLDDAASAGEEEFHERRLVCQALSVRLEDGLITLRAPSRFATSLALLKPGCTLAVEFEHKPEDRTFSYHTLEWAELVAPSYSDCVFLRVKTG